MKKPLFLLGCALTAYIFFGRYDQLGSSAARIRGDTFLGYTNSRQIARDDVRFVSFGNKKDFSYVMIGAPDKYLDRNRDIFVELPDSSVINLTSFDATDIILAINPATSSGKSAQYHGNWLTRPNLSWPADVISVQVAPYEFHIIEGVIVGLSILGLPGRENVRLGVDINDMRSLPYSGLDFVQIFGEPTEIIDTFRV